MKARDKDMVPRVLVQAMFSLMLASLVQVSYARITAKLNLFYGVPQINTQFVPTPLQHIKTYFRNGPITAAFPIGVTFLSVTAALFIEGLFFAQTPADILGFAHWNALAVHAAIEHWFMDIPLPDAKLWRWMLPDTTTSRQD